MTRDIFHVKMTNSPKEKFTMEKVTKTASEMVSIRISKNLLAKMKKEAGIVGKATPSTITMAYIKTTLNIE